MSNHLIRGTTRVVAVFGYPVKHSASPAMHNAAFATLELDFVYVPLAVAPESIKAAVQGVRALNLVGANVTVPLKELIPPLVDTLTPRARAIGSVNTIVNRDGTLTGDSTDGAGFLAALAGLGLDDVRGRRFVLLGAGGSARAIAAALLHQGGDVVIANRNTERAAALVADLTAALGGELSGVGGSIAAIPLTRGAVAETLRSADVIVNTTSAGMQPQADQMPVEIAFEARLIVCDLIYNPFETVFLRAAREAGCRTQNGVEMLVQQGVLSFAQWTDIVPPPPVIETMRAAVLKAIDAPMANQ